MIVTLHNLGKETQKNVKLLDNYVKLLDNLIQEIRKNIGTLDIIEKSRNPYYKKVNI